MFKSNEHNLKELINELLKEYKLKDKLKELEIIDTWPKIVGKIIANHTKAIYLRERKIYVTLDNAAIREELYYAKTKLLKLINKQLNENYIEEIILK